MPVHVFLSFQEEDIECVRLFRAQAKNRNNDLEFSDYSVKDPINSDNASYIKQKIREKITQSSIVLCMIGRTTFTSHWVKWELDTAHEMGRCLIGVRLHSDNQDIVPETLSRIGAKIKDWCIDDIMRAIESC